MNCFNLTLIPALLLLSPLVHGQIATDVQCNGCVDAVDLANGAVRSSKIAPRAVVTTKIRDRAVTGEKIGTDAVGMEHVRPDEIQVRIGAGCEVGAFIRDIAEDGSVSCGAGGPLSVSAAGDLVGALLYPQALFDIPQFYWVISDSGYIFVVSLVPDNQNPTGTVRTEEIHFETEDCTGNAYLFELRAGRLASQGYVFSVWVESQQRRERLYLPPDTMPQLVQTLSVASPDGQCIIQDKFQSYYSVLPNDPIITAVQNEVFVAPIRIEP